jgi:hypothetical protein
MKWLPRCSMLRTGPCSRLTVPVCRWGRFGRSGVPRLQGYGADRLSLMASWGDVEVRAPALQRLAQSDSRLRRPTWQLFDAIAHPGSIRLRRSSAADDFLSSWSRPRPKLTISASGNGMHSTVACKTHLGRVVSSSSAAKPASWTILNCAPLPAKRLCISPKIATCYSSC